ncbi:hypothetical protein CLF_107253 [Clonorchis sinensis]|uniref:Uncharacterized protein n=1 Tax=Clonorchis sinensis TaxID=79923 RepID=G7YGF5_CLOSI|nr:hypothetical protein CLF_107253 [Clonorchis sinensis]
MVSLLLGILLTIVGIRHEAVIMITNCTSQPDHLKHDVRYGAVQKPKYCSVMMARHCHTQFDSTPATNPFLLSTVRFRPLGPLPATTNKLMLNSECKLMIMPARSCYPPVVNEHYYYLTLCECRVHTKGRDDFGQFTQKQLHLFLLFEDENDVCMLHIDKAFLSYLKTGAQKTNETPCALNGPKNTLNACRSQFVTIPWRIVTTITTLNGSPKKFMYGAVHGPKYDVAMTFIHNIYRMRVLKAPTRPPKSVNLLQDLKALAALLCYMLVLPVNTNSTNITIEGPIEFKKTLSGHESSLFTLSHEASTDGQLIAAEEETERVFKVFLAGNARVPTHTGHCPLFAQSALPATPPVMLHSDCKRMIMPDGLGPPKPSSVWLETVKYKVVNQYQCARAVGLYAAKIILNKVCITFIPVGDNPENSEWRKVLCPVCPFCGVKVNADKSAPDTCTLRHFQLPTTVRLAQLPLRRVCCYPLNAWLRVNHPAVVLQFKIVPPTTSASLRTALVWIHALELPVNPDTFHTMLRRNSGSTATRKKASDSDDGFTNEACEDIHPDIVREIYDSSPFHSEEIFTPTTEKKSVTFSSTAGGKSADILSEFHNQPKFELEICDTLISRRSIAAYDECFVLEDTNYMAASGEPFAVPLSVYPKTSMNDECFEHTEEPDNSKSRKPEHSKS